MFGSGLKRSTGIHVGDEGVFASELVLQRRRASVRRCVTVGLTEPLALPEQLTDAAARSALASALHELKIRGVNCDRPSFGLTGPSTFVKRRFRVSGNPSETRAQLFWEAEQILGEDLSQYAVDVLITRRFGFVVAARRDVMDLYVELCRESGLGRPDFDVSSLALCNALEGSGQTSAEGTSAMVHLDRESARLVLVREGEFEAESTWKRDSDSSDTVAESAKRLLSLLEAELRDGETPDRLWVSGPAGTAQALAKLREAVPTKAELLDPFVDIHTSAQAAEDYAARGSSAFDISAGLAYRALVED
ncbi:MAG: hypothetical protein VX733_04440 [Candidatus Latescibacterota bacterium]|nr:hypothetical protein [Candidatus Latescibacterota bacterium]